MHAEIFSANYFMLKCLFQPSFNCRTKGKINNLNIFTFSIVVLSQKAEIARQLNFFFNMLFWVGRQPYFMLHVINKRN